MKVAVLSRKYVLLSVLALTSGINHHLEGFLGPKTIILPRSQSVNAARDLVGWQQLIHCPSNNTNYWVFALTPEYTHTFNSEHLTDQLFGRDCLRVTGSAVEERQPWDLLADYFGLPRDYESRLHVHPQISQFILDFNFYVGLDRIANGLFFILHFPIVHTKWDVNFSECVEVAGTAFDPAGYFSANRIDRSNLILNMREYFVGHRLIGDMSEPLVFQKIVGLSGRNEANRLSDVQAAVGYDVARSDVYHVGIEMRMSAPAGNRPRSRYLFDAVVGNGHHWELGLGLTNHYCIWHDDCHQVLVYLDANITHLFPIESVRSFNLRNHGRGSRFMMVEEIAAGSRNLFVDGEPATDQYTHRLIPAINVMTFCIDTYFQVQADVVLKLAVCRKNFCFDIGYNFWGRSQEKMRKRPCFNDNRYALKGDAQIYGFTATNTAIPLSVSQHQATIFAGQGTGNFVPGVEFANKNADNAAQAFGPTPVGVLTQLNSADSLALNIAQQPVATSQPSIFLVDSDLDDNSVLVPTSITNKFFVHAGHTWYSAACNPFLGMGTEVEWIHDSSCKSGYRNGGIAQWGIWWKLGLSY